MTKDCLDELKANLPVGHVFMSNASFSPWRPLYLQSGQDLYRDLRERFNGYYMDQVADWRRRAGLGVLSSGSPINSSPAVAPASVSAEVEVLFLVLRLKWDLEAVFLSSQLNRLSLLVVLAVCHRNCKRRRLVVVVLPLVPLLLKAIRRKRVPLAVRSELS